MADECNASISYVSIDVNATPKHCDCYQELLLAGVRIPSAHAAGAATTPSKWAGNVRMMWLAAAKDSKHRTTTRYCW